MSRFARRGHFVRWVEPRYLRWLLGRSDEFFRARDEQPEPNLQVRVRTLVNGETLPPVRGHNKFWLAQTLKAKLPANATGPHVLWLYNPHEAHLADSVPHDLLIYDIMDEYQGFPWSPRRIAEEEGRLLNRADRVFAGTQALYDAKRSLAEGKIECVLSGVETEFFSNPKHNPEVDREMKELRERHRKLIGYAGMIDLRIDQNLLVQAARTFPDWGFVLIGPIATDVAQLNRENNIHLLGQKVYEDLPAYYQACDALTLPFVENELTRHINPTKILEYAAAGKPIIARALPDVKAFYSDGAWLYGTSDEFMASLKTIEEADTNVIEPKLAIAREWSSERSWDSIAKRMISRIERLL